MLVGSLALASLVAGSWAAWRSRTATHKAAWEQGAGILLIAGLALIGAALAGAGLRPG